jgi:hypothetical protein
MRRAILLVNALLIAAICNAQTTEPSLEDVAAAYKSYRTVICRAAGLVGPPCDTAGLTLEEYCGRGGVSNVCKSVNAWRKTLRLAYDHTASAWMRPEGKLGKRTEFDINSVPTIALSHGERLFAIVQNTNPLLYAVSSGEVKQENIEQLADLQKLAGLLGGNISAVLSSRASAAGGPAPFDADIMKLQAVAQDLKRAQCISEAATRYAFNAVSFIQAIENGGDSEYELSSTDAFFSTMCKGVSVGQQEFTAAWLQLLQDQAVVGGYCVEVFDALAALLDADPSKPNEVRQAVLSYDAALQNPKCSFVKEGGSTSIDSVLRFQNLNPITNALNSGTTAEVTHQLEVARAQFGVNVRAMQTLVKSGGEALTQLIVGGGAVRKSLATREVFRNRVLGALTTVPASCTKAPIGTATSCAGSSGVVRLIVVSSGPTKVTWDKLQSHPIKIVVDSTYAADVIAVRPTTVETSYKAKSVASSAWDIGVAVTKTDLSSPVFGVGKNAANETVIAVTDEETRSGKLSLMFNYLPLRQLFPDRANAVTALGLQVGAGVDSGNPAFFWGISYGLGRYVRIGWGETSQRVRVLRGQTVGDKVPDKDAIQTRQKFANSHYFSLTISIGSLKFFNAS